MEALFKIEKDILKFNINDEKDLLKIFVNDDIEPVIIFTKINGDWNVAIKSESSLQNYYCTIIPYALEKLYKNEYDFEDFLIPRYVKAKCLKMFMRIINYNSHYEVSCRDAEIILENGEKRSIILENNLLAEIRINGNDNDINLKVFKIGILDDKGSLLQIDFNNSIYRKSVLDLLYPLDLGAGMVRGLTVEIDLNE